MCVIFAHTSWDHVGIRVAMYACSTHASSRLAKRVYTRVTWHQLCMLGMHASTRLGGWASHHTPDAIMGANYRVVSYRACSMIIVHVSMQAQTESQHTTGLHVCVSSGMDLLLLSHHLATIAIIVVFGMEIVWMEWQRCVTRTHMHTHRRTARVPSRFTSDVHPHMCHVPVSMSAVYPQICVRTCVVRPCLCPHTNTHANRHTASLPAHSVHNAFPGVLVCGSVCVCVWCMQC